MSPVSSAIAMKRAGATIPRCACDQRASASVAMTRPLSMSTTGW